MAPHRLVRYSLHRRRVVVLNEESTGYFLSLADSEPIGVNVDSDPEVAHGPVKIS